MIRPRRGKKIIQAAFALFITGFFIMPLSAQGIQQPFDQSSLSMTDGESTIYVDDDNTAGPWLGTIEYPYQFIQDGIDHATAGDTVYVFNGTYDENIVVPLTLELVGERKDTTTITGNDVGTVVRIDAEGVILTGFTICHGGSNPNNAGVLINTAYNMIVNTIIRDNQYFGVRVLASDNTLCHNNFIDNVYQAFDVVASSAWDAGYPAGGNYWSEYTGVDDNEDGVGDIPYPTGNGSADRYPLLHPYGSVMNENTSEVFLTIQAAVSDSDTLNGHRIMVRNGLYPEHVTIHKSVMVIGEDNQYTVITGRGEGTVVTCCAHLVRLQNFLIENGGSEEENAGVLLRNDECHVLQNRIQGNFHGILLKYCVEDCQISGNIIADNNWNGITIQPGCQGNMIIENTFSNNFYGGLGVFSSFYNNVYHNNFIGNPHQAFDDGTNVWDDGWPSGGNYWDDYADSDLDGDGIGDTPYAIANGINVDRYPLIAPYTGMDTTPPVIQITSPTNGLYIRNRQLLSGLLKRQTIIVGSILIEVGAVDFQTGIEKVEFYVDDAMDPVAVVTEPPYSWTWSQRSLIKHRHTIIAVAWDNAGNTNSDMIIVRKFL